MITLARKYPTGNSEPDYKFRYIKCMHHHGYLTGDFKSNKHDFYEINFSKSGDVMFFLGKSKHYITTGDIVIVPPNTNHYFTSSDMVSNYFDFYTLWISADYFKTLGLQLEEITRMDFSFDSPCILHTCNSPFNFEKEFHTLYSEASSYGDLSEAYSCGAVLCILIKIIRHATSCSKADIELKFDLINEIVFFVDKHFSENICLDDLAKKFHVSKSCLNKLFQKELKTTCHQYIIKKRLAESIKLIRAGIPFKQVAKQVGFNEYSAFYRAFKNTYKISPAECLAMKPKDYTEQSPIIL